MLVALLFLGILTMWIESRWAWCLFQIGVFILAAQKRAIKLDTRVIVLALAVLCPALQLISGSTLSRGVTAEAALDWWTFLLIFLIARDLEPDRFLGLAAIGA